MKKAYLIFLTLASACVFSCTSAEQETIENKVYFDRESVERVVELPVSIHDSYVQPLSARVPLRAEEDIRVTFGTEPSLVAEYNSFYGEQAELLPSEYYYFDHTSLKISKGTVFTPENNITFEGILDLDPSTVFVLPVTVEGNGNPTLEERAVIYYVFRRTGIVSVVANFDNNGAGVRANVKWNDYSLLLKPTGFTYEALMYCTFTSDGLPYDPARKNYPEGHEEMYIMTLMGATGTVNAIHVRYYLDPRQDGGYYWFELTNFNRSGWSVEGEHPQSSSTRDEQFKFYPDRKWFHWAVTFDKASRKVCWYCDGKLVSSRTSPSTSFNLISDDSIEDWNIGTHNTWYWAGKLSEVRIWNRALSADEINAENHFYYVDPQKAEGLAGYWKFNEGTGGTIYDHSGYGNHATVIEDSAPILWEKVDLPEHDVESEND